MKLDSSNLGNPIPVGKKLVDCVPRLQVFQKARIVFSSFSEEINQKNFVDVSQGVPYRLYSGSALTSRHSPDEWTNTGKCSNFDFERGM